MPKLVTVAEFSDSVQAAMARNYLAAAGVPAFLSDEATVATAWHLAGALGGIKLQVAEEDEGPARQLMAEIALAGAEPAREDRGADLPGEPDDDEQIRLTAREEDAHRALKGAIFGILFCPLQVYVFWLLLKVFASGQPLGARYRGEAIVAAAINLPFLLLILVLLRAMFAG